MTTTHVNLAAHANDLVRDLNRPKPAIYWADLIASAAIGWGGFAAALLFPLRLTIPLAAVAVAALYRALCFIHEISHQTHRTLPAFEKVWNLTTGFPLLLPSCMYVGVHGSHHRLSTYGTESDPEYLPFARSAGMTAAFAAQSVLLPMAFAVRFLVLAPISFFVPSLERWLMVHMSSLSMNVKYRREVTPEIRRMIRSQSVGILVMWAALGLLVPVRFFVLWYAVSACISLINSLRTLGAHAYESEGAPLGREEQLLDSIDTPGACWGVFWAPVGLRYHGLHHYFPGIPYHNLGAAYRRLVAQLPAEAGLHRVRSRGLRHSLTALCRKGLRKRR